MLIDINETVGEIVARQPGLSRVFEEVGVDYCCGGKKALSQACQDKGLDVNQVAIALQDAAAEMSDEAELDLASMSLTGLADHIEEVHHGYLRTELPRLDRLTHKVASVHGSHDPRLHAVRETFVSFAEEIYSHMAKEERVLFPLIRQMEAYDEPQQFHCGSIANPIRQMEQEHDDSGSALERISALTDRHTPPEWACNTYRAMLQALEALQRDMHVHVHKENSVLFPRAIGLEQELAVSL